MISNAVVLIVFFIIFAAALWLSTLITYPVTKRRAFDKTTVGESFTQFSVFPAVMFVVALASGFAHQCLIGPGCLDMSQSILVDPNSRASALGLKSGDTLLNINGASADCFGDLRLYENSTSATLIVKRSIANGGGQISLPLTARDSLQNLYRNGLHLPILRHPLAWRDALRHAGDYFAPVGYVIFSSYGLANSWQKPVSVLHPDASSIDLLVVGIFGLAVFSYLVPLYFAAKFLVVSLVALRCAASTTLPKTALQCVAYNSDCRHVKVKHD